VKGWQKVRRRIQERLIGQTGKRSLLVEGREDAALFRILLSRKFGPRWENDWALTDCGNKRIVTDILAREAGWFGVVDRDEWTDAVLSKKRGELPNLFILPRFCLESYAVDPDELWAAIPPTRREQVPGGREALKREILGNIDRWFRHGVLWSEINPLWSGLRALGFKEKLLGFEVAQDDDQIRETLEEWHDHLDPDRIFQGFSEKLARVGDLSMEEKLHRWVHGKYFFQDHVHPVLNRFLGQTDSSKRLSEIFSSRALPDDLEPLWERIRQD
jgi:hypothetical protein